jgi:hypothetical protein
MPRFAMLLVAAALAVLSPARLQAQAGRLARLSGTVYDSTLSAPLSKAMVDAIVADDPAKLWSTTTDERGAFTFDSLPAGTYIVAVSHARLDSLGVRQLSLGAALRAGDRERVRLAVPSAPTMIRRVCGDSMVAERSGYVRGVLRDAERGPLAVSGTVRVQWLELSLTQAGIGRQIATIEARADSEGRFTACGVPAEGVVQLRAWSGADSTGALELNVPYNGILLRDFFVGRSRAVALAVRAAEADSVADSTAYNVTVRRGDGVLRGNLRRTDGAGIPDVRLSVWGTGVEARSGVDGRYRLPDLPTGSYTVDVRAIGYVPLRQVVDVTPFDSGGVDIVLDRMATLDTVRIMATRGDLVTRRLAEFEYNRRVRATGRFIVPETLEKHPPMRVADIFRTIPGVRVVPASGGDQVIMRGQSLSQWCTPDIWIDGVRTSASDIGLDVLVNAQDILAAEVYNSGAAVPAQLASFSGCGAIVLYTGMRERVRK